MSDDTRTLRLRSFSIGSYTIDLSQPIDEDELAGAEREFQKIAPNENLQWLRTAGQPQTYTMRWDNPSEEK